MGTSKKADNKPMSRDSEGTSKYEEGGQDEINSEEAREKARRSGMTKGTAGTSNTRSNPNKVLLELMNNK
jgi:hypothetical protein